MGKTKIAKETETSNVVSGKRAWVWEQNEQQQKGKDRQNLCGKPKKGISEQLGEGSNKRTE